jgi:hypothetical protein
MTGVLGGLLGLADWFGGLVLMVLIGGKGWSPHSSARNVRILFGSYIVGVAVGIVAVVLGLVETSNTLRASVFVFGVIPVCSLVVFLLLEVLRLAIDGENK